MKYICCFCSQTVDTKKDYLASLIITAPFDAPQDQQFDQQFFCHLSCFQKKIATDIPLYIKDVIETEHEK